MPVTAFAEIVKTSRQNITNLEKGVANVPRVALSSIARVLGMSIEDMLNPALDWPPAHHPPAGSPAEAAIVTMPVATPKN